MKGTIKANTVDKYLNPLRHQISDLIEPQSEVIEFGCGNGDLLLKLSSTIKYGLGIDKSHSLIDYANEQKERKGILNIDFQIKDLRNKFENPQKYDYAVASLLFHVLPWDHSIKLLKRMNKISRTIIICGFCKPTNKKQEFFLWLDQRFSGHYKNFKAHKENGYIDGLLKKINTSKIHCFDTFDPVIKLYKIGS